MPIEELIERYCEETSVLEDKNSALVVFYGSRVTGTSKPSSDLDVFIVSYNGPNLKRALIIDGIKTETEIVPLSLIYDTLLAARDDNNAYFSSVFNTGKVVKNDFETFENIKAYWEDITTGKILCANNNPVKMLDSIKRRYCDYRDADGVLKEYYYYNLIELMRCAYHSIYKYQDINLTKVYDFYKHPEEISKNYHITLPPESFRTLYLQAITSLEYCDAVIQEMLDLLGVKVDFFYGHTIDKITGGLKANYQIQNLLISINKRVCKLEELLMYDHPAKDLVYYVTLYGLKKCYLDLNYDIDDEFEKLFTRALVSKDNNERITLIEELFAFINQDKTFDYDDYVLKLY